jgi:hypothetical protein
MDRPRYRAAEERLGSGFGLEEVERAGRLPWPDDPVEAAAATGSRLRRSDDRRVS